jgi:hypothetical protein
MRALFAYWNTGIEARSVDARALTNVWNVGIEDREISSRVLYPYWNLGIGDIELDARSLFGYWNVISFTKETDPPEFILLGTDLLTAERILVGK